MASSKNTNRSTIWRQYKKQLAEITNSGPSIIEESSDESVGIDDEIMRSQSSDDSEISSDGENVMYGVESDVVVRSFDEPVESDSSSSSCDNDLSQKLKEWALKHGCTKSCVNDILKIFNDFGHDLPKDSRTLLSTVREVSTQDMQNGDYCYIGVANSIRKLLGQVVVNCEVIELKINIDGLPLFKSSSIQLWPILIQFDPFNPISVAFFCGRQKPAVNEFVRDFVDEMTVLLRDGITLNGVRKTLSIKCFISDAPARSMLKSIVQHTGYYSCERCVIKGVSVQRRVVFDKEMESEKRTDECFRQNGYGNEDSCGKKHQLDVSPLLDLPVNFISQFVLDYMHLVCLGITRYILYYFKGAFKGVFNGRLSAAFLNQISQKLQDLNGSFPSEFARQPRSLSELDRWKATEFRSFLLYSGPVVLRGLLSQNVWKHFMSLSLGVRILCDSDDSFRKHHTEAARQLLKYFVYNSKEHYGETFCVYNVHGLLHLPDDVEFFQLPLDAISAFQFENHLYRLKRSIRGKKNPLKEVVKRSDEFDCQHHMHSDSAMIIKSTPKDSCFLTNTGVAFVRNVLVDGMLGCEFYKKSSLDNFFEIFGIASTDLSIFVVKSGSRFVKRVLSRNDLIKKCVTISYKADVVIIPLLH